MSEKVTPSALRRTQAAIQATVLALSAVTCTSCTWTNVAAELEEIRAVIRELRERNITVSYPALDTGTVVYLNQTVKLEAAWEFLGREALTDGSVYCDHHTITPADLALLAKLPNLATCEFEQCDFDLADQDKRKGSTTTVCRHVIFRETIPQPECLLWFASEVMLECDQLEAFHVAPIVASNRFTTLFVDADAIDASALCDISENASIDYIHINSPGLGDCNCGFILGSQVRRLEVQDHPLDDNDLVVDLASVDSLETFECVLDSSVNLRRVANAYESWGLCEFIPLASRNRMQFRAQRNHSPVAFDRSIRSNGQGFELDQQKIFVHGTVHPQHLAAAGFRDTTSELWIPSQGFGKNESTLIRELQRLKEITATTIIPGTYPRFTSSDMRLLKELPNLHSLRLSGDAIDVTGRKRSAIFEALPAVRALTLINMDLTATELDILLASPTLRDLEIDGRYLSSKDLRKILGSDQLRNVTIVMPNIEGQSDSILAQLGNRWPSYRVEQLEDGSWVAYRFSRESALSRNSVQRAWSVNAIESQN